VVALLHIVTLLQLMAFLLSKVLLHVLLVVLIVRPEGLFGVSTKKRV